MLSIELAKIHRWLEKCLYMRRERLNTSPYRVSVLSIHKKEGILLINTDFYAFNKQKLRNVYPKLHVDSVLDR